MDTPFGRGVRALSASAAPHSRAIRSGDARPMSDTVVAWWRRAAIHISVLVVVATLGMAVLATSASASLRVHSGSLRVHSGSLRVHSASVTPVATPGISAPPDLVVSENDGLIQLPVRLSAPGTSTVTVGYSTGWGTAAGGTGCPANYDPPGFSNSSPNGTLTFLPGVTTQVVPEQLLNCNTSGSTGFRSFLLVLSTNSSNSTITRAITEVDITGDVNTGTTPALSVRDVVADTSAGTVNVPVLLGGPSGLASSSTVSVPYTTHDSSAIAGTDYTTTSGTLTFPPGETAENIPVPIIDRSGSAPSRSFSVTLGTPTNATIADGTGIVTLGASGAASVSMPGISAPPDVVVGETDGYIDLPVTLSAPGTSTVTVGYSTGLGTAGGGTACPSNYYPPGFSNSSPNGTLTFLPGVTTQVVREQLLNCNLPSPGSFDLVLSGQTNSTITRSTAIITIVQTANTPGKPTGATAVPGNGTATLSFAAPASDGGDSINSYIVTASPSGPTATGPASPIAITGLTNGTSYTFTVSATNSIGTGPASLPSNAVTPVGQGFTITTSSLPSATPGLAYGPVALQEAGAGTSVSPNVTTLKWKKVTLPKGLRLNSAGVLSGTLNKKLAAGPSSATVQVTETVTTLNGKKKVKTKTTVQATIPLTIT